MFVFLFVQKGKEKGVLMAYDFLTKWSCSSGLLQF